MGLHWVTQIKEITSIVDRNLCKKDCGYISNGKHIASAQKGPSHDADIKYSQNELYVIPETLIKDLFDSIGRDGS